VLSGRYLLHSDKSVSVTFTPAAGVHYHNYPAPRTWLVTLKYAL
jgi:iron complex outermembrane receptor protein